MDGVGGHDQLPLGQLAHEAVVQRDQVNRRTARHHPTRSRAGDQAECGGVCRSRTPAYVRRARDRRALCEAGFDVADPVQLVAPELRQYHTTWPND